MNNEKEVIYLIGDFRPDVLERWTKFAELTNRIIQHTSYADLPALVEQDQSLLIILDHHGLNELQF
jgi:hypothetical protein